MTTKPAAPAVIYCRVSSAAQVKKGDGIGSQETRCREYAKHRGYRVIEVFRDEGVSGGMIDRPAVQALLAFLKQHRKQVQHVVIIDDISRLARGLEAHIRLRAALAAAGGKLESPSIEFGEDSDSMLVENLLASVSQHQRQKNTEQVINRMRARVMNGYWVFAPPVGYRYERVEGHGKMLVRDEPNATLVTQALEGYAAGRFENPTEVLRFLQEGPAFTYGRHRSLNLKLVIELLQRSLYAGYIDVPKWQIVLHPGKQEPLISFETYQRIQDRLAGKARAPIRKDISTDFPLRGFLACASCGQPMTAAWAKGRHQRYAYYHCFQKGCPEARKSIRKERVESEFETLLEGIIPNKQIFLVFREMVRDLWVGIGEKTKTRGSSLKAEIAQIEARIARLTERVTATDSPAVIEAYETQIHQLHTEKIAKQERLAKCGRPLVDFDDAFRTAFVFLANPYKLWRSPDLEDRRTMLRLSFGDRLAYCRNEVFRTAETTLPFKLLAQIQNGECGLVEPRGIEPLTSAVRLLRSPN